MYFPYNLFTLNFWSENIGFQSSTQPSHSTKKCCVFLYKGFSSKFYCSGNPFNKGIDNSFQKHQVENVSSTNTIQTYDDRKCESKEMLSPTSNCCASSNATIKISFANSIQTIHSNMIVLYAYLLIHICNRYIGKFPLIVGLARLLNCK